MEELDKFSDIGFTWKGVKYSEGLSSTRQCGVRVEEVE